MIYSHGRDVLREMRGEKQASKVAEFIEKYWQLFVGAALVALVWAVWAEIHPTVTYAAMRTYAEFYANQVVHLSN